jgi:glycosyltransferase involved in cell wall biosynthesis
MALVLINALASTAGGGITYLRNVLPRLARFDPINRYLVLVPPAHAAEYRELAAERVSLEAAPINGGLLARWWWEQSGVRSYIKAHGVEVLISLGNFALLAAPVPQILFSRNDLYFSPYFERDLRARRRYAELLGNRLKRQLALASIKRAEINVAPTAAFAERLRSFNGQSRPTFEVLHFGVDPAILAADGEPLPSEQVVKLRLPEPKRRILYVSHYNYFRNFETLLRALPLIKERLKKQTGDDAQLVLTTELRRGAVYSGYDATAAAELIDQLGVRDDIAMLGAVDYGKLHHLYRLCDLFVCPSYSESFGHPLVEAMAAGRPVVAADLDVHREVCGEAAIYFDVFDERALAAECVRVLADAELSATLRARGAERCRRFSWDEHVRSLIALIERCLTE